jgi:hypothetical protein
MKTKSYWLLGTLIGLAMVVIPLISAVVTASGALGSDPAGRVNRVDFVWAAVGLVLATYSLYQVRHHKNT